MKKISLALIFFTVTLILCGLAWAYSSSWTSINSSGGSSSSSSYQQSYSAGSISSSKASSSTYSSDIGFIAGITATGDASGPLIQNVMVDGVMINAEDYVAPEGTLTATITDASGINTSESYVGYDTYTTYFDDLSGDSSFNVSTGALTYKMNIINEGDVNLKIMAADNIGNLSTHEVAVVVDSGSVKARDVLAYPNPYDPSAGSCRIAYMLNKDTNVTVYVFNSINQPVWKRSYTAGTEGGHTGYNEIVWDGVTDFGGTAGNDIYFVRLVADGKEIIGKVKLAVVR